jgi:arylsulfatase A-like enzyme
MPTSRRDFMRLAVPAALGASSSPTAPFSPQSPEAATRPPNVILVITDDQGYGDLGCTGNPILRTPHIDSLHAQSVRFTNFHVDPLCAPTRAALLTGRYAFRCGVTAATGGRSLLNRQEVTAAEWFRANEYRTAIFGKWHLGDNYPLRPSDRGFEESIVCASGGVAQAADHWGNDYFDDTYSHNNVPTAFQGYCTDVFFDAAIRFLEEARGQKFFLMIPTNAPHAPYIVDEKYSRPYRSQGVPPPMDAFYGMIANLDENMGRLLAALQRLNLEQNTILIFMTDNGTSAGFLPEAQSRYRGYNSGMRGRKAGPYEGGHRVPFFFRWPGGNIGPARDIDTLAAHIDVLPTLADLCRLHPPRPIAFDGISLRTLLTSAGSPPSRRSHFAQHHQIVQEGKYQMESPVAFRQSVVMKDHWRLVNGSELYDVKADPAQQSDIAARHPSVVAELRAEYEKWYADVSQGFAGYCRIVVGSEHENPTRLTCFDWHGERVASNQEMVKARLIANGFWALEAARPGMYEFTLRERPVEDPTPLLATAARLRIGEREMTKSVASGSSWVTFRLPLAKGDFQLQTWLHHGSESRGAYYVYVRYLGGTHSGSPIA